MREIGKIDKVEAMMRSIDPPDCNYFVVRARSTAELNKKVNEMLRSNDWKLRGGPFATKDGKFHQGLVRKFNFFREMAK